MSEDPDNDDAYASDDYEPESPTRAEPPPSHSEHSPDASPAAEQQQMTFEFGADAEDDESDAGAVTPMPKARSTPKRSRAPREADSINGRHLMDHTPWTYIVSALKVRMLRIPVAESTAIRELRVFATIDKQAAQSRGSRWKQDLQAAAGSRRSGLIEEAKWVRGDGRLQWTFPMEKFRRLKAYAPRIKAFVYGIREVGVDQRSRTQMQSLSQQEKDGAILSFGWFFLDLRTPDLPERWLKLQNSPYGGEILISSTFLPVEISPMMPTKKAVAGNEDGSARNVRAEAATAASGKGISMPTVVSEESGEYLQIGDSGGEEIFVLSVFIQTALNFTKLVENAMGEGQEDLEKIGFWLSYSLFDVVVQTDVFYDLNAAEFPAVRDSFRVKSSVEDLALCIEALSSLTVFLCTENRVLAGVEIPLRPLLSKELFSGLSKLKSTDAAEIEGKFSFPDFDDAVVAASVAVELVESIRTDSINRAKQADKLKEVVGSEARDPAPTEHEDQADGLVGESDEPLDEQMLFKLDTVRLKRHALSPFAGKESVSIQVTIGERQVSGVLVFCAFTKHHAIATIPALGVVLEHLSSQRANNIPIGIRCVSTESNRLVAGSSETTHVVQGNERFLKSITLPLLSESSQTIGECILSCTRGPTAHQQLGRELLSDAAGDRHHYRICLKLKSVRDIDVSGGYCLRFENPFLRSASISSDWFTVRHKGETDTLDFYCMLDLRKDPLQLKQEMQEAVEIELISSEGERVGRATFSLNYLFFSEERFCCSEDTCREIFMAQAETEAHWLEVHTESALPDTQAGPEAYSHSYRSCSVNIPIMAAMSQTQQQPQRVGSLRVSAYLEDIGLLMEKRADAEGTTLILPSPPLQKENKPQEDSNEFRSLASDQMARDRSNSTSVVREAEETRDTSPTKESSFVKVIGENSLPSAEGERDDRIRKREQQREASKFKEEQERERSAWRQEQHLQQLQWKRRFAEMEKARMDELEEEWARREEERSNLLKAAQKEYQQLEQKLRESLADLETRERRLSIAEASLQREQDAKRDENETLQRRLKTEQKHSLSLAKKQTEAYERRIALLESQLNDAERRSKQVEADFTEYRQQQRKLPESKMREEIAALKGNISELEKQKLTKERECENAEAKVDKMKMQLEQMSNLLAQEKKKHEARVVDELEKLRVKYIAREEKYVLDGDRDELRAIKKQLDDLKGFKLRGNSGKRSSHRYQRSHEPASPQHRHHWHTQSRQASLPRDARSASHQRSRSFSDRASDDESEWGVSSLEATSRVNPASLFNPDAFAISQRPDDRQDAPAPTNEDGGENGLGASEYSNGSFPNTELGRLLRERKLLLASGAYDTQSYLVQELDRLISITKANAELQSSIA